MPIFQLATPDYQVFWQMQAGIFSGDLIQEAPWVQGYQPRGPVQELIAALAEPAFALGLQIDQIRIRDPRGDRVRLQARLMLDPSSDGIDPSTEPVTLELSTPSGAFYPGGCTVGFPITPGEFELREGDGPRRWSLTEAARLRTGIERFDIFDGSIVFVDRHTILPSQPYDQIRLELTVGNDHGSADANLFEHPPNRGHWRER